MFRNPFQNLHDRIRFRVIETADYIIKNNATVRRAAFKLGWSKSTIHDDMIKRLPKIDTALATAVKTILAENKAKRSIRGGEATSRKWFLIYHKLPHVQTKEM